MTYRTKYNRLIAYAKAQHFTKVNVSHDVKKNLHYHHIIPKSIDSNSTQCVCLTILMHVVCHYYLWYAYKDECQFIYANKMKYAYKCMVSNYFSSEYDFLLKLKLIEYNVNSYWKQYKTIINKPIKQNKVKKHKQYKQYKRYSQYQPTTDDWQKLNAYNDVISHRIQKKLPNDWKLSIDDIKSEVNETFIKLIKLFIPKLDGMSLTSYCYKYAEKYTFQRLIREYNKLKKQISYEIRFTKKYESNDEIFKHQYGYYDMEPYITIDNQIEQNCLIDQLMNIANPLDRQIIKYILNNGLTFEQISNKLSITKGTISKRLKKYANILK